MHVTYRVRDVILCRHMRLVGLSLYIYIYIYIYCAIVRHIALHCDVTSRPIQYMKQTMELKL